MATQFENGLTLSELAERNAELVTEVEKLRAERDASLNAERVWEKTMMEVCGEDGPVSVASEIRSLQTLRDTAMQALKSQVEQLAAENVALALENVAMKQIVDSVTNLDNEPQYHAEGMGCGLEDRGITDRYDACRYGWDEAMERVYGEVIPCADELDFSATDAYLAGIKADGVEEFVSNTVHKIFDESDAVSALAYLSLANSHVKKLRDGAEK
ncbi:hypothetical protein [Klebsiella pneumoniae]|uniref:hypothetical protein n=1 Tax=Klebsiella pneumoniae TaxID=573 RepID=UPI000DE76CE5|nr:hypothetical protein [Klebsiella pneumoniae]MCP5903499.1 hypothetical protein [Klebsiella pneumoniae]MCP5966003.1 hypothetical protein [Klebsiella pneumoniae]MDR7642600.1 hypothetical protein [Klebsiella pneumoniae]SSH00493.1 Uncharacterised protein [Klebsiella pneumoniae]SWM44056.1 Uncharacterised protein [Klebsiella pneumoniae]